MNTEEVNPPENATQTLRDELIRMSTAKEIKYSEKYLKKASQPALEKIKQDHDREQLEKVNSLLTETLISKFSGLMVQLNMVENNDSLDKELSSNKLFCNDVKTMVMKISPYIPMIGLLTGGFILAKHVWINKDEPQVQNAASTGSSDSGVGAVNSDNDRTVTT